MREVVVTGRAVVSPLGVGLESHWQALVTGRSAVATLPRLAALALGSTRGAQVTSELMQPHADRLPRKQQKLYNRPTSLAMLAAGLAMDDAGLAPGAGDPTRFGVLLGVNTLAWDVAAMTRYLLASEAAAPGTLDMAAANAYCMRNVNPLDYSLKTLPNLAAGHVAIAHDARAVCRALTEGPLGSVQAIGQGFRMIEDGDLDAALCGGADAQLEETLFATYAGAGLLAGDGGGSAGVTAAEGSGVLVLEEAGRARARGATIHGRVCGFATAAGAGLLTRETGVAPLAARLERVVGDVMAEAGGRPDVVAVHGDRAVEAATRVLEHALGDVPPVLRFEDAHGDLGAAAGAVALCACSAVLDAGALPAVVAGGSSGSAGELRRALVITLGLFGECAAVMYAR